MQLPADTLVSGKEASRFRRRAALRCAAVQGCWRCGRLARHLANRQSGFSAKSASAYVFVHRDAAPPLQALPPGVPIDLASVCFAAGTSPDRAAALDALEELAAYAPERYCTELLGCS